MFCGATTCTFRPVNKPSPGDERGEGTTLQTSDASGAIFDQQLKFDKIDGDFKFGMSDSN